MSNLVFIKNNDVFTNSLIIAGNLDYEHKSIVKHFRTYKNRFERHGALATQRVESNVGRKHRSITRQIQRYQTDLEDLGVRFSSTASQTKTRGQE